MQMTSRWRTAALVAAALFAGSIIGRRCLEEGEPNAPL